MSITKLIQRRSGRPIQLSLVALFLVVTVACLAFAMPRASIMFGGPLAMIILGIACSCDSIVNREKGSFRANQLCRRLTVLLPCVGIWSLLAALMAYRIGRGGSLPIWLSTLAGPFSFIDSTPVIRHYPTIAIVIALVSFGLVICHPIRPRWYSVFPTVVGVSLWFLAGFLFTYSGV